MLPGTLCTAELFAQQIRGLPEGALVLPLTQGRTVTDCAAWVLSRAPERFALAGFSQGAVVALEVVRRAPERVARLALLSANPGGTTPAQRDAWRAMRRRAQEEGLAGVVDGFYGATHPASRSPALREVLARMAQETGVEAFVLQLEMLESRIDSRPYLPRIACPTLVVAGDADPLTPAALHEELASSIPGAALHVLGRCGHYSPLERPRDLTELLANWLSDP